MVRKRLALAIILTFIMPLLAYASGTYISFPPQPKPKPKAEVDCSKAENAEKPECKDK